MSNKNQLVLITGASSGLGRELSIALSSKGYHCILASRNESKLRDLVNEIESQNYNMKFTGITVLAQSNKS